MKTLGSTILRSWRLSQGMTQMQAAAKVDIDLFHYSKIERGKNIGLRLALKFRDVAGIDPGDWCKSADAADESLTAAAK